MSAARVITAALAILPAAASKWGKPLRFRADGTFKLVRRETTSRTQNARSSIS